MSRLPMHYSLPFGLDAKLELDLPPDVTVNNLVRPIAAPLQDPAEVVMANLQQPLNYPPLAAATVPGDLVAIAVEPGLPQVEVLVAAALYQFLDAGTNPHDISVVIASNRRPPLTLVPTEVRKNIRVVLHNPGDQEGLQYLAADREARPIYMNRVLCEADFVLPITMSRLPSSLLYVGGNGGLFPTFSDLETQQRFRSPQSADHGTHQKHRRAEANEAVWNLGVHFLLQVVPGAGDELLHVVAGEAKSVIEEARRLHIASWLHPNTAKAGLTIAAVDGDEDQQTWENFACALDAAMQCTVDGGTIVLLSNVNCPIGPAFALLTGNERGETLNHHLQKEHSPDAQAAAILADARERFDLFLHSGLSAELVEELGVGHIADLQEVVRLAKRYPTITLLGSAQHAGCQSPVLV